MPELPEVETTVRGLRPLLVGQTIKRADLHKPLRFPFPPGLAKKLAGRKVLAIERRAKYILVNLDDGATLLLHLGMSGRLSQPVKNMAPEKHDHIVLQLENDRAIHFRDPRRFGIVDYIAAGKEQTSNRFLKAMGPEPLDAKAFTPAVLGAALKGKTASIKALLLDQSIVAGLGNIYVCEALYYTGIRPTRAAGKVTKPELTKLLPAIRKVLNESIKVGGSSLRDYADTGGDLGHFQKQFAVYGNEGESCPACPQDAAKGCAGNKIKRITQGGRSSWFCPVKQK